MYCIQILSLHTILFNVRFCSFNPSVESKRLFSLAMTHYISTNVENREEVKFRPCKVQVWKVKGCGNVEGCGM